MAKMTEEEFNAHFTPEVTEEMNKYVTDEVFIGNQYIFTKRLGKKQSAYCTHCHNEWWTDGLRHGEDSRCPSCDLLCTVKASGRGRKHLVNEAYFVYYQKSLTDPDAVVARGVYVVQDFHGEYRNVKNGYMDMAMYLFKPGRWNSHFYWRSSYYLYDDRHSFWSTNPCYTYQVYEYKKARSIYSLWPKLQRTAITTYSRDSLAAAVMGTPFEHCGWEKYEAEDMTRFMALAAKYPCVEYLTKLGFDGLVDDKLKGWPTYGAINWNGKTLNKVLKLTKQDMRDIKQHQIDVTFSLLRLVQASWKDGSNFTLKEAADLDLSGIMHRLDEMLKHSEYGNLRKILHYLLKQRTRDDHAARWIDNSWSDWRDYVRDAITLHYDLTDETILWPRNLQMAHQTTILNVKVKVDKELAKLIRDRAKMLKKYSYEKDGIIIRPVGTMTELIREGMVLHHCVGSYATNYAKGYTQIFVVRQQSAPKLPYYTVEIRDKRVVQIRGKNNCAPVPDIKAFMDAFVTEKLNMIKKSKKEKVA